jgi:outer membrane protein assembly factor BamB
MVARLLVVLSATLAVWASPSSYGNDWHEYLGNKGRTGYSPAALPPSLDLVWTYQSSAKPEKAWAGSRTTPIEGHVMLPRVTFDAAPQMLLVDGFVYFGSTVDHRLYCRDEKTGREIWSYFTEGPIRLAPSYAFGCVYFGSDDGWVYCLNARTGDLVWKHRVAPRDDRLLARGEMISRWPVRTGVLIDGEIAYFGAGVFPHEQVYLCAADAKTGEILWKNDRISQADAGRNDLSPQGYMLANDTTLFVPSGRSLPVAVSKATGEILFQRKYSWRTDAGGVVGGTKAVLGDGQIYAGGPHHFLAMDEVTGELGAGYISGRLMVLAEDKAYLLDGEKVFCVDREEHAQASKLKQEWFLRARKVQKEPEKLAEAQSKIKEYQGVGVIWEFPCDLDGTMIATNDLVIVGGKDRVIVLDRQSGALKWQASVNGNAMGLAVNNDTLMVSTDEGTVYAFRKPDNTSEKKEVVVWPGPYSNPFPDDEVAKQTRDLVTQILKSTGQSNGYCLVLGSEEGRVALELIRQSQLNVYCIEPDEAKCKRLRTLYEEAGVHATRITVLNLPYEQIPLSNYFANLIFSERQLLTGILPCDPQAIARFLKPCGGTFVAKRTLTEGLSASEKTDQWLANLYTLTEGELVLQSEFGLLKRGKLPGAGEWTHQYGNIANTSMSNDMRVKDGLGVLWYGDPGPSMMINRHEAAGAPLSTNGRMFIQGTDSIMAYDAYNGTFLWSYDNPGAIRTGVFNNRETHNLCANDDTLFVAINDICQALDAATGRVKHTFKTPASSDGIDRAWAYVANDGRQLFGTSTIRQELEEKMRRRGLTITSQTDGLFAYDIETKDLQWVYRGESILHTTIAISPDHLFFIESNLTSEQRQDLYRRDKGDLKDLTGEAAIKAEEEMKALDMRKAVCLDRATGKKLWEQPVDVTDTTNISAGGGSLTVLYSDGCLLLCGANANGHYWKQFLSGEFEKRKLIVLEAATGKPLWSKNANYMNRPAIINDHIYAEPWAFELKTGAAKQRQHPVTGKADDWQFSRPGHHCGIITATPNMMFFRSGFIGYYDLYKDSGTQHFAGQRLGCWINAIPGNGLVMIPEASAGCVCQFSIASTVVMEPKSTQSAWGILSAVGPSTPVKRLGINLGGPGDRLDGERKEWLGYPRPLAVGRLEFVIDLQQRLGDGGAWFSNNEDSVDCGSASPPWIFASAVTQLEHFEAELLGPKDIKDYPEGAKYNVKLYFIDSDPSHIRSLPIQFQGKVMEGTVHDLSVANCKTKVIVREFQGIDVDSKLIFDAQYKAGQPPIKMAAMEIIRDDQSDNSAQTEQNQ